MCHSLPFAGVVAEYQSPQQFACWHNHSTRQAQCVTCTTSCLLRPWLVKNSTTGWMSPSEVSGRACGAASEDTGVAGTARRREQAEMRPDAVVRIYCSPQQCRLLPAVSCPLMLLPTLLPCVTADTAAAASLLPPHCCRLTAAASLLPPPPAATSTAATITAPHVCVLGALGIVVLHEQAVGVGGDVQYARNLSCVGEANGLQGCCCCQVVGLHVASHA